MDRLYLTPHPNHLPSGPLFEMWVNIDHAASFGASATTNFFFCVGAPASRFVIAPEPEGESEPGRTDELWKTTCFEAFLRPEGETGYTEYNFAPSGEWAAYDFTAHRAGMAEAEVGSPPYIRVEDNLTWWGLGATIAVPVLHYALGLSAVLEEQDGTKSYWALAHPHGAADFHHGDCFTARLG